MSEVVSFGQVFLEVTLAMIAIVAACVWVELVTPTKSKKYRKYLADMFVSSKLRKLAKADDLNLIEEEKAFGSWSKKNKIKQIKEIDDKIVEEVNAEIDEVIEKQQSKQTKAKELKPKEPKAK